jgi:hypothetical protein
MTRIYRAIWTPLMLGGIVPGLLLLAVLAASLATQSFSLADEHASAPVSSTQPSVTYNDTGDSRTLPPRSGQAHSLLPLTGWMLDIGE